MVVRERKAARVLLLDRSDRLLLFRGFDPAEPERTWWVAPGGGLDPGEDPRQAALRELREETGLTEAEVELGPVVAENLAVFSFDGRHYEQQQWFYLARTVRDRTHLDSSGCEPGERDQLTEARWWSVAELRGTTEQLYPQGLADLVAGLLKDGPPVLPVRL
ncbi:NUDIX hydrolase [Kitasatospora nipponensis]